MKKNKKDLIEKDDRLIFNALDIGRLNIPPHLLGKFEEYINLLWKTNVLFGFSNLTEAEQEVLERIEFKIVFFQKDGLVPQILFIIDKKYLNADIREFAKRKADLAFAERILGCMYSDLGVLPSNG